MIGCFAWALGFGTGERIGIRQKSRLEVVGMAVVAMAHHGRYGAHNFVYVGGSRCEWAVKTLAI
jgi:hypothetical protein